MPATSTNATPNNQVPPYTAAEKAWLKQHWDGEFKFLASYALIIYNEDDRAEGRLIVRAMMAAE
jgi:hypothetical protein